MNDSEPATSPVMRQMLTPQTTETEPARSAGPLALAATGLAGAIAGGVIVALIMPESHTHDPQPTVAVYSCAEQYTQLASGLNDLVSEGIQAGQASIPDMSWISSINDRQETYTNRLEALSAACATAE